MTQGIVTSVFMTLSILGLSPERVPPGPDIASLNQLPHCEQGKEVGWVLAAVTEVWRGGSSPNPERFSLNLRTINSVLSTPDGGSISDSPQIGIQLAVRDPRTHELVQTSSMRTFQSLDDARNFIAAGAVGIIEPEPGHVSLVVASHSSHEGLTAFDCATGQMHEATSEGSSGIIVLAPQSEAAIPLRVVPTERKSEGTAAHGGWSTAPLSIGTRDTDLPESAVFIPSSSTGSAVVVASFTRFRQVPKHFGRLVLARDDTGETLSDSGSFVIMTSDFAIDSQFTSDTSIIGKPIRIDAYLDGVLVASSRVFTLQERDLYKK